MKRVNVLCVGKLSKSFCRGGCDDYLKRLKSFYDVKITEIPEKPTVKLECAELVKRMNGVCALMDVKGKQFSSEELARFLSDAHMRTDEVTFVIGGASGVDDAVRQKASARISFGAVTYPHQLVRVLLCEQLYRAATILNRLPYHK